MTTSNLADRLFFVKGKSKFSEYAKLLGSIKSKAKAKASRENGKKGGRPKKKNDELPS